MKSYSLWGVSFGQGSTQQQRQIMLLAIIPGGQELYANHPVVAICCQTGDTLLKFKIPWACSAVRFYQYLGMNEV